MAAHLSARGWLDTADYAYNGNFLSSKETWSTDLGNKEECQMAPWENGSREGIYWVMPFV